MRFFLSEVVWQNEPTWVPDESPEIFLILVSNTLRYSTFHSQYTYKFVLNILSVRDGHGGGWSRKINAWHLYTLMVYL